MRSRSCTGEGLCNDGLGGSGAASRYAHRVIRVCTRRRSVHEQTPNSRSLTVRWCNKASPNTGPKAKTHGTWNEDRANNSVPGNGRSLRRAYGAQEDINDVSRSSRRARCPAQLVCHDRSPIYGRSLTPNMETPRNAHTLLPLSDPGGSGAQPTPSAYYQKKSSRKKMMVLPLPRDVCRSYCGRSPTATRGICEVPPLCPRDHRPPAGCT